MVKPENTLAIHSRVDIIRRIHAIDDAGPLFSAVIRNGRNDETSILLKTIFKVFRGVIGPRLESPTTGRTNRPLPFTGHPVAIYAFKPGSNPQTEFMIRDVQDDRLRLLIQSLVESLSLSQGSRKTIEQPSPLLPIHPFKDHGDHGLVRDIFASIKVRPRLHAQCRLVSQSLSEKRSGRKIS